MEKETRAGKYGRFFAVWINYALRNETPDYRRRFFEELKKYSFKPRKKGEPKHDGCLSELEGISELEPSNPLHPAKVAKEGYHLMYQKQTSFRNLTAFWQEYEKRKKKKK